MTAVVESRRDIMNTAISKSASNRQRVANGENTEAYIRQERLLRKWKTGTIPPRDLLLGSLPVIPQEGGRVPECMRPIGEVDYEC